ncbi:hypothetical protein L6164_032748 [Bauhinia variegata]|uniref:Uncharacterized protein n=1 Tax=Bauhinia variegata TaxID=167791 RepID=A0ACB9KPR7_BAUVA|nr:hypothetical protein L6164_032748 [Bauhinia variegata]
MKDQGSKRDQITIKSLSNSACSSSSNQARRISGVLKAFAFKGTADSEKQKQAENSLRTVMYLSCWGPN